MTPGEWTIRVCECGFPLGATLAVLRLKTCPDCGARVVPVEDRTRRVAVREIAGEAEVCGDRSPLNYDRTRWATCVLDPDHDGDHQDADGRTWQTTPYKTMPCHPRRSARQ